MDASTADLSHAPDEVLLDRFAKGHADAARILTMRLAPRVLSQATRLLSNPAEAEEVAQEAMLRLWKQAPDWETGRAQVSTWLYRVTANLCTDRLRRRRRNVALDAVAEPEDTGPSVARQMQDRARADALQDALASLPERQAQAVALRHLEGLSNPEIGEILGCEVRAVESLIARGKRGLIAALGPRKAELGFDDD